MTLKDLGIEYKVIDKQFVSFINFRGEISDIPAKINELAEKIKQNTTSPAIAVIDYGVYSESGKDIDVCIPIQEGKNFKDLNTKYLDGVEVLSIMHNGPNDTLKESFQKIQRYRQEHVVLGTAWLRLVYHKYNLDNPEENKIEIQHNLHRWDKRLERSIDQILGKKARNEIMKDRDKLFTIESSYNDRIQWLKEMLNRLDQVTDDDQKYEIVSRCAHDFSRKRISYMKEIYQRTGDIDAVIKEMHKDNAWYEKPIRKGNKLYVSKVPVNQEEYDKAKTPEEKRKNYCHCSFINENLDKGISPTFCNCGTGWYRQQWEGIIEKPVKIKVLKSLLKGDNFCQVEIHLPPDVIKN
ncbi:MAG: hypothetical protein ACFFBY_06055 [Promethearchaeota archaeon]